MMLLLVPCPPQDGHPNELRASTILSSFESGGIGARGNENGGWMWFGTWGLEILMHNNRSTPGMERPEGRGQWAVGS